MLFPFCRELKNVPYKVSPGCKAAKPKPEFLLMAADQQSLAANKEVIFLGAIISIIKIQINVNTFGKIFKASKVWKNVV